MTVSRWRWLTTSIQSRPSRPQLPIQRSACALALGAISGVRITRAPLRLEDPLGLGANFLSRSWINTLRLIPSSSSLQLRLRACWVSQAAFGSEVQLASRTRRDARCTYKEDVEPPEEDRVYAEEIGGNQGLGVRAQEFASRSAETAGRQAEPGRRSAPSGSWSQRLRGQASRARRVSGSTPTRVLARHPQNQLTGLG